MSDQPTEGTATDPQQPTDTTEQQKPSETVDFWKQKAREQEKRAKDNAEAAKRLADIEESQKSEVEKSAGRIADLEQRLADAERTSLRFKVASQYGISDEDASLFLTGSDEEALTTQAKRLAHRESERQKNGNHVPTEGTNPQSAPADEDRRAFVRNLTGRG